MAKTGRPPKPTALKILQGNPGQRPLNKYEPKADGRPICPAWLSNYAKTEWRYIVPILEDMGLLGKVDRAALVAYCEAYADMRTASEALQVDGMKRVFRSHTGTYLPNPWVTMLKHARQDVMRYAAEFGMTPSARSRIEVKKEDEPSLADVLFEKTKG